MRVGTGVLLGRANGVRQPPPDEYESVSREDVLAGCEAKNRSERAVGCTPC
jgi:hypothetical protein